MAAIPTCAVRVRLYDTQAVTLAGATVTAKLDRYEVHDGFVVPDTVTGTTDAFGECVLNLWPNALGSQASIYKIKIQPADGKAYTTYAMVPDQPSIDLDLIATVPDTPGKADFQEFFDQASGLATDLVNSANAAKTAAQASQTAAAGSATGAAGSATSAATQAAAALASSQSATTSANAAEASRVNAVVSETNAAASATAAAASSASAAGSSTSAGNSATAAAGSATNAANSATAAAGSATTASTQASNASASATAAATSATNAATSEANALTSKNAAATSATNAGNSATAAATSATNAGNSATAAATSATNAANSATSAAASAASAAAAIVKPGDAGTTTGRHVTTSVIYDAAITATRTVTLNATDPAAGDTVRVTRTAAATGAFSVSVGGLKSLTAGQFAHATYDGAAWVLTGFGSL